MNSVAVFEALRGMLATNTKVQQIASTLPMEDQQLLQTVAQYKDEELPKPSDIPIA